VGQEPDGHGRRYRIFSPSAGWKAESGHVRKRALIGDLEELGARGHWGDHVDVFAPSDPRGDGVPLISADVGDGEVRLVYYGGDEGMLMLRVRDLVETWKVRYTEPELRIVEE
jgi:hypothetical protein